MFSRQELQRRKQKRFLWHWQLSQLTKWKKKFFSFFSAKNEKSRIASRAAAAARPHHRLTHTPIARCTCDKNFDNFRRFTPDFLPPGPAKGRHPAEIIGTDQKNTRTERSSPRFSTILKIVFFSSKIVDETALLPTHFGFGPHLTGERGLKKLRARALAQNSLKNSVRPWDRCCKTLSRP